MEGSARTSRPLTNFPVSQNLTPTPSLPLNPNDSPRLALDWSVTFTNLFVLHLAFNSPFDHYAVLPYPDATRKLRQERK